MHIRQETPADYPVVYTLIKDAFASAEHCDGNEQDLAAALRQSTSFVPELSLVAETDGRIVGHILFTKIRIGTSTQLALAPLSVLPAFQGQGVGSALVRRGHQIARDLGYSYSVVLGSETYYPRSGYRPAESFGIEVPPGMPPANFMAVRLRADAQPIGGAVTYADEFGL